MDARERFPINRKERLMRRVRMSDLLASIMGGVLMLCFSACDTIGGVGAGVYVETEPTIHDGHHGRKSGPPDHAPAHGYRKKHTYHYYHDEQVYYDTSRGLYFYFEGSNWQVSASLPSHYNVHLGGYVTIEMDSSQPHMHHKEHKKKYPPGYKKEKKKGKSKGKGKGHGHHDD